MFLPWNCLLYTSYAFLLHCPDGKVDMKKLTEEYDELEQAHETTYGEFKAVRDDLHRLWKVKSCVDNAARFNERRCV